MQADNGIGEYYILFQVGDTTYGIRSNDVKQMEMVEHITPVPNAPKALEGIVILRNQVIPVLNLRERFGLPKIPYDLRTRLIVVQQGQRVVGLIADSAREFVSIPREQIGEPPQGIGGAGGGLIEGIATLKERLVLIVNLDNLINPSDALLVQGGAEEELSS